MICINLQKERHDSNAYPRPAQKRGTMHKQRRLISSRAMLTCTSQKRACTDVTETLLNKQNLLVISRLLARRRRQVVPQSAFQSPPSNFFSCKKSESHFSTRRKEPRAKGTKKISHVYMMCVESCNYLHKRDER